MQQGNPTSLRVPDPGIRALFEQDARWQAWLDVEAALARAEAELGMIPAEAAVEIVAKCDLALFDRERLTEGFRRTAHQLVPLVWELARLCEGDAGNHVHWGATTQNITQTGDILQLRKAHGDLSRPVEPDLGGARRSRRALGGNGASRPHPRPARGAGDLGPEGGDLDRRVPPATWNA